MGSMFTRLAAAMRVSAAFTAASQLIFFGLCAQAVFPRLHAAAKLALDLGHLCQILIAAEYVKP